MKVAASIASLWRYGEMLAVEQPVTLGEGWTPLIDAPRTAEALGCARLLVKDEGRNPTGSFKDRSASVTIAWLREHGARGVVLSSTGNAGAAFATYAARAGIGCVAIVPTDVLEGNVAQISHAGAELRKVAAWERAAAEVMSVAEARGYTDVSAARTSLRLRGKKTLGYEIAEQMGWRLPEAVICPTGGGTGILALRQAFEDLRAAERVSGPLPRLFASQYDGCAPIAAACRQGQATVSPWTRIDTPRGGMRTPAPVFGNQVLAAIAGAHAISPVAAFAAALAITEKDGVSVGPEGGTALATAAEALRIGEIGADATIVVINTATPLKADPAFLAASTENPAHP